MAEHRTCYECKLFSCYSHLNTPKHTPFGTYIVGQCDPDVVEDYLLRVLKTILTAAVIGKHRHLFFLLSGFEVRAKPNKLQCLMESYIPHTIRGYNINTILMCRTDCGPLSPHNGSYMSFHLAGRKLLLEEAFIISLLESLQDSTEWVELDTLIAEKKLITNDRGLINEFLRERVFPPADPNDEQYLFLSDEVEMKRNSATNTVYLRCTGKRRRRSIESKSVSEEDDWQDSWLNIKIFDTIKEMEEMTSSLYNMIYHLPTNAFTPLPSTDLFRGAILLHGGQHGVLISFQTLARAIRRVSRCEFAKITIRPSTYSLPIYNIPGARHILQVTYIRVVEQHPQQHFYDMPIFLYDAKEYNVRTRGAETYRELHFLDRIDVGGEDTSPPEYDCFNYELQEGIDHVCFQSSDESCGFQE